MSNSLFWFVQNGDQSTRVRAEDGWGNIQIHAPVRTVSEANWTGPLRAKMKRKQEQRTVFAMLVKPHCLHPIFPCTVKLTRHAKGRILLDDDNLRTALKHCRDGVADGLGKDDSAKSGVAWEYAQLPGQKSYGVTVEIRWGGQ